MNLAECCIVVVVVADIAVAAGFIVTQVLELVFVIDVAAVLMAALCLVLCMEILHFIFNYSLHTHTHTHTRVPRFVSFCASPSSTDRLPLNVCM